MIDHTLARHGTSAPFPCMGPLVLRLEPSHKAGFESLVVQRCGHCGRVVELQGVMAGEVAETLDDCA